MKTTEHRTMVIFKYCLGSVQNRSGEMLITVSNHIWLERYYLEKAPDASTSAVVSRHSGIFLLLWESDGRPSIQSSCHGWLLNHGVWHYTWKIWWDFLITLKKIHIQTNVIEVIYESLEYSLDPLLVFTFKKLTENLYLQHFFNLSLYSKQWSKTCITLCAINCV